MQRLKDLSNQKFGKLTAIEYRKVTYPKGNRLIQWKCKCECGNETWVFASNLKRGTTQSCGCLISESNKSRISKIKQEYPRLYRIWRGMKSRCDNPKFKYFKNYGGRGITYCPEWKDFKPFLEWALANGYEDTLTLERTDNDKGYDPDNCKWASYAEQSRNKRNSRKFLINGEMKCVSELEREHGFKTGFLYNRLYKGMPIEEAINTPIKKSAIPTIYEKDAPKIKNNKMNYIRFYEFFTNKKSIKDIANSIGISASSLKDWKRGVCHPNKEKMQIITNYLGVENDYFLKEFF